MAWDERVEDMAREALEAHAIHLRVQVDGLQASNLLLAKDNEQLGKIHARGRVGSFVPSEKERLERAAAQADQRIRYLERRDQPLFDRIFDLEKELAEARSKRPWWRRLFR